MMYVQWLNGHRTWISLNSLRLHDPYTCILYYTNNNYLRLEQEWDWVSEYIVRLGDVERFISAVNQKKNAPKYQFGVQVPTSVRHALQLDKENGNTLWEDAIKKEIAEINQYNTFRLPQPEESLNGFKRIPYHIVFAVKFDGRRKARLVAGGNLTEPPKDDVYSGVVSIESI